MSEDFLSYGDKVEVIREERTFDGRVKARIGQRGVVQGFQHSPNAYIPVHLEGNLKNTDIMASKLKLVERNEEERKSTEEYRQKWAARMKELNPQIDTTVQVRELFSSKIFNVHVTKVDEYGIRGYRVKKSGERFQGNLGHETYFTANVILDPAEAARTEEDKRIGKYCFQSPFNQDYWTAIGKVVKTTARSIYVKWSHDQNLRRYSKKYFSYGLDDTEEVQERIAKGKQMTLFARDALSEAGFDVSAAIIKIEE